MTALPPVPLRHQIPSVHHRIRGSPPLKRRPTRTTACKPASRDLRLLLWLRAGAPRAQVEYPYRAQQQRGTQQPQWS